MLSLSFLFVLMMLVHNQLNNKFYDFFLPGSSICPSFIPCLVRAAITNLLENGKFGFGIVTYFSIETCTKLFCMYFFALLCRLKREVANLPGNPPESRLHVIVLKLHMKEHIMILKF